MHAGYPWLPDSQSKDLAISAAASETAQAAAASPEAKADVHASDILLATPSKSSADSPAESAWHKTPILGGAERPQSEVASGAVLGLAGAALGAQAPYTPPSAGRGSEGGVSTSEPSSLSAKGVPFPASTASPMSKAQVTSAVIIPLCD